MEFAETWSGDFREHQEDTVSVFLNIYLDLNKRYCTFETPYIFSISILNYYYGKYITKIK